MGSRPVPAERPRYPSPGLLSRLRLRAHPAAVAASGLALHGLERCLPSGLGRIGRDWFCLEVQALWNLQSGLTYHSIWCFFRRKFEFSVFFVGGFKATKALSRPFLRKCRIKPKVVYVFFSITRRRTWYHTHKSLFL